MGEQVVLLEHDPHLLAHTPSLGVSHPPADAVGARAIPERLAVEPNFARLVRLEEVDTAQERGLAAAAAADERHHLAVGNVEIDPAQHSDSAERLLEPANLDHARSPAKPRRAR